MKTEITPEQAIKYCICIYTGLKPKSANEQPKGELLRKYRCRGSRTSIIDMKNKKQANKHK